MIEHEVAMAIHELRNATGHNRTNERKQHNEK